MDIRVGLFIASTDHVVVATTNQNN